jgi:hypothetical protein
LATTKGGRGRGGVEFSLDPKIKISGVRWNALNPLCLCLCIRFRANEKKGWNGFLDIKEKMECFNDKDVKPIHSPVTINHQRQTHTTQTAQHTTHAQTENTFVLIF